MAFNITFQTYYIQLALQFVPHISATHTLTQTFIHQLHCQPHKATDCLVGAVRVRCLAQGYFSTWLGDAGVRTSILPVASNPALSPEPMPPFIVVLYVVC